MAILEAGRIFWPVSRQRILVRPGEQGGTRNSAQSFGQMDALIPLPGTDWTDYERAQISRLEARCHELGHWDLECKHTDEGDPWCVIYDPGRGFVVLHIARIDRRYVVVSLPHGRSMTVATIEAAVDIALTELA